MINGKFILGTTLFLVIGLCALFGPIFSGYTYFDIDLAHENLPPSHEHWFGTDDLGRDLFTRAWFGARISLFVGIAAALIDLFIGALWGSIAAFSHPRIDDLMMRIADTLYALPYLLIVILLLVVMGPGLTSLIAAMTVIGWITMARIVRGQILQIKHQEYVLAARALGAGFWRILFRHLLPNTLGSILVTLTLTIPAAIFTEAFLSFLGLGVQAPVASWGTMANEGLTAMAYYPWRLFIPAALISITMFAFYLIGEGLREIFCEEGEAYVSAS
jgi:oligopeptide transport system permease protein